MIEGYLNQTATWHYTTGKMNDYAEPETNSKSIEVRWEGKRRLVRDKEGREVVSEARVFCTEAVNPGDYLEYDGHKWSVLAVAVIPGLNGEESHREVAV